MTDRFQLSTKLSVVSLALLKDTAGHFGFSSLLEIVVQQEIADVSESVSLVIHKISRHGRVRIEVSIKARST